MDKSIIKKIITENGSNVSIRIFVFGILIYYKTTMQASDFYQYYKKDTKVKLECNISNQIDGTLLGSKLAKFIPKV